MDSIPILSIVTFLPVLGALMVLLARGDQAARSIALFTTAVTFLLSLIILFGFDPSNTDFQFVEENEQRHDKRKDGGGERHPLGVALRSIIVAAQEQRQDERAQQRDESGERKKVAHIVIPQRCR